jgi:hypothetical protein
MLVFQRPQASLSDSLRVSVLFLNACGYAMDEQISQCKIKVSIRSNAGCGDRANRGWRKCYRRATGFFALDSLAWYGWLRDRFPLETPLTGYIAKVCGSALNPIEQSLEYVHVFHPLLIPVFASGRCTSVRQLPCHTPKAIVFNVIAL